MPKRDPRSPVKLYYRIGEVAEAVGVRPHVLRYWESEFGSIRPQKSARGQRVYSHKDLERLLRVKKLLHSDGYTIAGARKKLREKVTQVATETEASVSSEAMTSVSSAAMTRLHQQLTHIRAELQIELDGMSPDV